MVCSEYLSKHNGSTTEANRQRAIGKGVEELRIWDESGTYRMIYTARLRECVAVLHGFQKKTQTTSPRDIKLARARWAALPKEN
jgi:phage-related protein